MLKVLCGQCQNEAFANWLLPAIRELGQCRPQLDVSPAPYLLPRYRPSITALHSEAKKDDTTQLAATDIVLTRTYPTKNWSINTLENISACTVIRRVGYNMPLRVIRAEKTDIPQLVDLYFNTFKSALVLKIKPNVPPVREWFERNMRNDMDKPHTHVYKVEEFEAASTQTKPEIIAFAKWSSPHAQDTHGGAISQWPLEGDATLFEEVVGKATEKKRTIMGGEKHWCKLLNAIDINDIIQRI